MQKKKKDCHLTFPFNLRNRTGEERRRQTILFETTLRETSLSFKQIFL